MSTESTEWVKSSFSNNDVDCVEVAAVQGGVLVRDSQDPQDRVLLYSRSEWRAFVEGAKAGEFDRFAES